MRLTNWKTRQTTGPGRFPQPGVNPNIRLCFTQGKGNYWSGFMPRTTLDLVQTGTVEYAEGLGGKDSYYHRPRNNPYEAGTPEHQAYETAYDECWPRKEYR